MELIENTLQTLPSTDLKMTEYCEKLMKVLGQSIPEKAYIELVIMGHFQEARTFHFTDQLKKSGRILGAIFGFPCQDDHFYSAFFFVVEAVNRFKITKEDAHNRPPLKYKNMMTYGDIQDQYYDPFSRKNVIINGFCDACTTGNRLLSNYISRTFELDKSHLSNCNFLFGCITRTNEEKYDIISWVCETFKINIEYERNGRYMSLYWACNTESYGELMFLLNLFDFTKDDIKLAQKEEIFSKPLPLSKEANIILREHGLI